MARTAIAPIAPIGPFPTLPVAADSLDITFTPADVANGNVAAFGSYSRLLVLARNVNASAQTFTIQSAPDVMNREGDIGAYSLAQNEFAAFMCTRSGWRQADGGLYLDGAHADIQFAVIGIK